ncbi:MAG: tryptophan-rich sensory protein [Ruminococcaceae bacterium]|nr:tryptophan-rich sensory protein [Oscillospiraceae bacterium]
MILKIKPYIISILIALGVGGSSAFFTRNNMDIYSEIKMPPLSPPSWLFPVVWTILFILMGISAAMIYNTASSSVRERKSALYTYAASLFFNFFWSIIFFNMRAFLLASIWIVILLFLIIRTIMKYYKIKPLAAYLQIPYLIWVSFATYLTFAIWLLNR